MSAQQEIQADHFAFSNYIKGQEVKYLTFSNISASFPTETDDYAEIIDEEDTYTMPSSKQASGFILQI